MDIKFLFLQVFFGVTTLLSVVLFIRASAGYKKTLWIIFCSWMVLQGILSYAGFYLNNLTMPPRFALVITPPLLLILALVFTRGGRRFIDQLNQTALTVMHTVRVPVEFTLLWLFSYGLIPGIMTFEGRNFDIISGITAPLIAWLMMRKKASKAFLILWNFICLGLVLNVVINGILSVPSPFQQLSFDQPNLGVLLFPFVWLPGVIVPLVIFSHIVCLGKLFRK